MNQEQADLEPNMSLPKPQAEISGLSGESTDVASSNEKAASLSVESAQFASGPQPDPLTSQPISTISQPSQALAIPTSLPNAPTTDNPAIADDVDLIEKEWVLKAKNIVEMTRSDPYNQNREMNKVKADYLKKRYNKDLKLGDE